jgi:hypothetical protein
VCEISHVPTKDSPRRHRAEQVEIGCRGAALGEDAGIGAYSADTTAPAPEGAVDAAKGQCAAANSE